MSGTLHVRAVDCELADARALVPPPPPSWDAKAAALKVAQAFACFAGSPFAKKRDLLRRAVRDITLADGATPSITLQGGFLGEILGANLEAQSRSRYWRRCRARAPPPPRRRIGAPAATCARRNGGPAEEGTCGLLGWRCANNLARADTDQYGIPTAAENSRIPSRDCEQGK